MEFNIGDYVTVYFCGQEELSGELVAIHSDGVSVKHNGSWQSFHGSDVKIESAEQQLSLF